MSSPLATLKKGSARAMPFRIQPEFQMPKTELNSLDVDRALLEDVVNAEVKKKETGPPTDFALMQSMITRIQQLEKQVQFQAKEIIEKDKAINKYQEQIAILQKANESSDNKSKTTELQAQCFILRKQVEQMEEFLADYGLIWVGDSDDDDEDEGNHGDTVAPLQHDNKLVMPLTSRSSGYWNQESSLTVAGGNFVPNFETLLKNIKELNFLAGEGQSTVQTDLEKKEARLKPSESIPITFYINGLVLFDGPFRPYSNRETRQLVVDILDGYFPSELQKRYPDGVPFKVTDRREAVYKDKVTEIFAGKGNRLKSATERSDSSQTNPTMSTVTSDEHKRLTGKTMSEEQFLGTLPKNVIKSGKIVDIREGVANSMHSSSTKLPESEENKSGGLQVIETKLVQEFRERMANSDGHMASAYHAGPKGRPGTPRAGGLLVTLRIRSEEGSYTYVLKVRPSETIGDIRNYINAHRKNTLIGGKPPTNDYAIVQNFPKHVVFEDKKATLEQCGLMSNAALFLRRNENPIQQQLHTKILSSASEASQT